jgi:hypothetical protein
VDLSFALIISGLMNIVPQKGGDLIGGGFSGSAIRLAIMPGYT